MTGSDPRVPAIQAALLKLDEIFKAWYHARLRQQHAEALLKEATEQKHALMAQIRAVQSMGELFGFDAMKEHDKHLARLAERENPLMPMQQPTTNEITASFSGEKPKTIREHAIAAAQQAYPNPIRASALRRQLETMGLTVHEKTIGMTFFRLSRQGILSRKGWDWFFVPENQRRDAVSQAEESPGDEPGLGLQAAE